MELRSRNRSRNGNGKWNRSKEKNRLKTDSSDCQRTFRDVAEGYSRWFALRTSDTTNMDSQRLKLAVESELRRGTHGPSIGDKPLRLRRWAVYRGALRLARVSAVTTSSFDRDEHDERIRNVLLSQQHKTTPATAKSTEVEAKGHSSRHFGVARRGMFCAAPNPGSRAYKRL